MIVNELISEVEKYIATIRDISHGWVNIRWKNFVDYQIHIRFQVSVMEQLPYKMWSYEIDKIDRYGIKKRSLIPRHVKVKFVLLWNINKKKEIHCSDMEIYIFCILTKQFTKETFLKVCFRKLFGWKFIENENQP